MISVADGNQNQPRPAQLCWRLLAPMCWSGRDGDGWSNEVIRSNNEAMKPFEARFDLIRSNNSWTLFLGSPFFLRAFKALTAHFGGCPAAIGEDSPVIVGISEFFGGNFVGPCGILLGSLLPLVKDKHFWDGVYNAKFVSFVDPWPVSN